MCMCVPSYLAEGNTNDRITAEFGAYEYRDSARSVPHKKLRRAVLIGDSSQRKEQSQDVFSP